MYEHHRERLLPRHKFARRVARHLAVAVASIGAALGVGVGGYHWLAGLTWTDALLNASMILGGMGPVNPLETTTAKVFASFYALFSGLAFIGIATMLIVPFAHRLLHRLHVDEKDK